MTQVFKDDIVYPVSIIELEDKKAVENFKEGDLITVSGITKGKGWQGVVKRHGFHGGPKSHGQKDRLRAPGSIGSTDMQRVVLGRKMAGRMGNKKKTIKNLLIVSIDGETGIISVCGSVPGNNKSKVVVS